VEKSTASVKRRGKNISQPLAFPDLGQSEFFTERSQPRWLSEGVTAENTEGGRQNTVPLFFGGTVLWMHKPDRTQEENV